MAFILFPTVSVIIILSQFSPTTSSIISSVCSVNATTVSAVPGQVDFIYLNYPSIYYLFADCRWLIEAGSGYVVKVSVLNADQGYEFVYLYDGTQLSNTFIIIKYSTMLSQYVFYSSGQYMYIRIYNYGFTSYSRFKLTYEAVDQQSVSTSACSVNTTVLSAVVGEVNYLESPDYPNNYHNSSCQWLITAPTDYIVRVTLLEVSLDECCDYLNFVDGMSESDPSLGSFYDLLSQRLLNSSGQYMYINFSTNGTPRRGGFHFYYEAVHLSECPVDGKNFSVIPGETHYLTSPNYPLKYHNNADCRWLLYAPRGNIVKVTVWTVDVDLHNDYLQILDGMSDSSPSIATFRSTPSQKVYSSCGQYMLIRFFTNFLNVSFGFNLTYETVPIYTCSVDPTNLTAVVGESKELSSSYPTSNCHDVSCQWLITAPTGYVVRVSFVSVSIVECCDYLSLVDGMSVSDPSLGRFNVTPSQPIISSGQYMYMHFSKNGIGVNGAFSLYYEAVRLSDYCIGGNNLSVVPGQVHDLTSPNYPLNYYNFADCWWLIDAGRGYVVKVTVNNVSLEICCDYLEIYDDTFQIISTSSMPSQSVFYSSGQYMYIRFYSDGSVMYPGFRLTYEATPDSKIISTRELTSDYCIGVKNLFVVPGQIQDLTFPNNPFYYYNYADCWWVIDAGSGYVVKVSLILIRLETDYDYLKLYDDAQEVNTLLTISTSTMPSQYVFYSSGQYMYIRLHSDRSYTSLGFSLTYEATPDPKITSTRELTSATTTSASSAGQQRVIHVKVVYRKKCTRN